MKKINRQILITLLSMVILTTNIFVYSSDNITVFIDDNQIVFENEPYMENDRVMVPMRAIFEKLGANVRWDNDTMSITATKDNTTITMAIGMNSMFINGSTLYLDVAPALNNSRTFVPLRAVSEAFSCKVSWLDSAQRVDIETSILNQKTVFYFDFPTVPDFGALFDIEVNSVFDSDFIQYNYKQENVLESHIEEYKTILQENGFLGYNGDTYEIYIKDDMIVLFGFVSDMFRIVVKSE